MYLFPHFFLPLLIPVNEKPRRTTDYNPKFATLENDLERYQKLDGFNYQTKTLTLNPFALFEFSC